MIQALTIWELMIWVFHSGMNDLDVDERRMTGPSILSLVSAANFSTILSWHVSAVLFP